MENKTLGLVILGLGSAFLGLMNMAFPNSTTGQSCPETFVGKVQEVKDEEGADGPFKKIKVGLRELGGKGGMREIKALKHGENVFKAGDVYRIGLSSGYLCEVSKIASSSN